MVECESIKMAADPTNKLGFNRYMVECEYRNSDCGNPLFIVLIDTWWNVNNKELTLTFVTKFAF